jgi:rfaE bifunctional protein kinase chain/domain/rfaE bifunctional protein nucleotidyltransferase chain/domain
VNLSLQRKILTLDDLTSAVQVARTRGKTIVQCHGCFDIVHPGHVRYLQFARSQGDVLIVTLTGDSEISKGGQRPYIPQELRAENLAALIFVDYVHIDPHPTAEQVLARIRPDLYVKGREYERSADPDFLAEKRVVEEYGGRIIFSSGEIVFSSTDLIERMPQADQASFHRLRLVANRHDINAESISRLRARFRDLRVVVIGDVVTDRYVFCDALGVATESPMLTLAQREERTYVGGAAIVARHVAALGGHAFLLSAGGADPRFDEVQATLERNGVECRLIASRPTIVEKTRYLAEESKLFKVDHGQRLPLDSVAEREAAQILEQIARTADAVIFCDFGYGMITGSLLGRVLPTLRHNVPVLTADVSGKAATMPLFRFVDLLCPTERELRTILNDFNTGLSTVAWQLLDRTQARHLFVTLEKRGMVVFERRSQDRRSPHWSGRLQSEHLPSLAGPTVDRLGCGDALLAAATLSLAAGGSLMQSAYLGSAAAALEIAMLGNQPVTAGRLGDWLATRSELVEHASCAAPVPVGA